ncbi:MAG TPA: TolC family protein [Candidatus Kapabacteria bacterium]|nr:TolC family protein [Candidatus Kapabacteria bacterium]
MKIRIYILSIIISTAGAVSSRAQQTDYVPDALKSYIETALSQNPDVMASRSRLRNTDAKVSEARAGLIPHLDFVSRFTQYSGGRVINIPNVGEFNTSGLGIVPWDNKFEMVWPIGNYAVWQGMDISSSFRDASTAEVSAKELTIGYQVTEAYYNYAKTAELVAIRQNADTLASENLRMAQALFANDKAPKNDVLRAEVGVAQAEGDVISARNMAILAQTNFNSLLKRDYNQSVNLPKSEEISALLASNNLASTSVGNAGNDMPSLEEDAHRAYANRPELIQLQKTGEALGATKRAMWADYLPVISLFASYGWQETDLKFSSQNDLLLGGVQLQWNFFSGFGTGAKVAEQEAQIEELRYQAESAVSAITLELESARLGKVDATQRLGIARKLLTSAEENYRIVKAQYDNGLSPLITLIDAQTTLSNAKANLTTTTYDLLIATAKYKKALGVR